MPDFSQQGATAANPYGFSVGIQPQQQAQQAQVPDDVIRQLARTPFGHPSFATTRARPGMPLPHETNPMTGQPFTSYQEWMSVHAPSIYQQAPSTRPFAAQAQQAMPFFQNQGRG